MKALVLVEHLSTAVFYTLTQTNRNTRLFISLGSARFKMRGSSFLVTFLVVIV